LHSAFLVLEKVGHRFTSKECTDNVYRHRLQTRARTYVYVYAYVYVRVHIHAHLRSQENPAIINDSGQKLKPKNKRVACSWVLASGFSCLLGARARTSKQEKPEAKTRTSYTDRQMIVAASCGTKNNNASLQSNN